MIGRVMALFVLKKVNKKMEKGIKKKQVTPPL
jgi:hypothetical protein